VGWSGGGTLSCNIPSRHKEEVEVQLYPRSTSTLEVVGWGTPRPSRFAVRKEKRCALYSRQSVLRGRCGWVRKNFEPTGFRGPGRPTRRWSLYRLRYHSPVTSADISMAAKVGARISNNSMLMVMINMTILMMFQLLLLCFGLPRANIPPPLIYAHTRAMAIVMFHIII